jgi:aspartate 4-decarboxylase
VTAKTRHPDVRDSAPRPRQKDQLIRHADENRERVDAVMLNAGRGNPNWIATQAREAFFLLGKFALGESVRAWDEWEGLGGMPVKEGIARRFAEFLDKNEGEPGAVLLRRSEEYASKNLGLDADRFIHELTDAITGDNYPVPDRMLVCIEKIVHNYLIQEMCPEPPFPGATC